jgi:hypothetical protein
LINRGPEPTAFSGPLLTECVYPDVLVARAASDGTGLDLVLYNGGGPGPHAIKIERLAPGRSYQAQGATPASFTAPADGAMILGVEMQGRTEVRIRPQ